MKKTKSRSDFDFIEFQDRINPHLTLLRALVLGVFFKSEEYDDHELQSVATSMRENVEKLKEIQTDFHQKFLKTQSLKVSSR